MGSLPLHPRRQNLSVLVLPSWYQAVYLLPPLSQFCLIVLPFLFVNPWFFTLRKSIPLKSGSCKLFITLLGGIIFCTNYIKNRKKLINKKNATICWSLSLLIFELGRTVGSMPGLCRLWFWHKWINQQISKHSIVIISNLSTSIESAKRKLGIRQIKRNFINQF